VVVGFIATAMSDSPEALEPLPISQREEIAIEKTRLHYGIPPFVNIDEHGHIKKASYEQVDPNPVTDFGHSGTEIDQETDELLWFLGVPLNYSVKLGPLAEGGAREVKWTVPGR
jgi:hypothetical protein